ncbi:hypothetical protein H1Q78_14665 [Cellulosimicrobium cellulans]|nr:hypothetical protein H1Q78_14665 [Cellulosimicrobium cellulans]
MLALTGGTLSDAGDPHLIGPGRGDVALENESCIVMQDVEGDEFCLD